MDFIKEKQKTGSRMYSQEAVLNLMLQGKSREEICVALQMPRGTVNTYCTRIYKQTGCNSLVELVLKHNALDTDRAENIPSE